MPILDNFDSQFMPIVTDTNNGLMSSYDKIKLDSILLDNIKYINNGLDEINNFMESQFIYGIKIDKSGNVTYTDDATTFIPLKVDTATGICNYGSWKSIIDNILGIQPCLVKNNGEVIFKLNPNDYAKTIDGNSIDIESGEFGQVMIRFNHIYYKFSTNDENIKFQISNKKIDTTWIDTAFASENGIGTIKDYMYISAYEAVQKNNILQSVSNALPSFKLSYDKINELTQFGVFHMMNIIKKQFITFLGYLVTKSIDLKGTIGTGNIAGNIIKTGSMNTKGLFYGKNTNNEGVKLFGIENLWGNQLKYMNGIIQKIKYTLNKDTNLQEPEQHLYIKESFPYDNIDDFINAGKIEPNRYGYISSLKFLSRSIYIPDKLNGSSISYYKSYFQNGESLDFENILYGIYGGSNKYNDKAGPEFLLLAHINPEENEVTSHLIY